MFYVADYALADSLMHAGLLSGGDIDTAQNHFRSDTGEIEMNAKDDTLKIMTPRAELFVVPAQS